MYCIIGLSQDLNLNCIVYLICSHINVTCLQLVYFSTGASSSGTQSLQTGIRLAYTSLEIEFEHQKEFQNIVKYCIFDYQTVIGLFGVSRGQFLKLLALPAEPGALHGPQSRWVGELRGRRGSRFMNLRDQQGQTFLQRRNQPEVKECISPLNVTPLHHIFYP